MRNKTAGSQTFIVDGAAGDPASVYFIYTSKSPTRRDIYVGVGVAALLANWTNFDPSVDFATASTEELEHLLTVVPRTSDGAISHRESEVQLWYARRHVMPYDSS